MTVGTTLTVNHAVIRLLKNSLIITDCELDFVLEVQGNRDKRRQADAIERMRFWLENVFEGCIVIPVTEGFDLDWLSGIENPVMFAPGEPNDFTLQALLHAKLTAIGNGDVSVASSHMRTNHSRGFGIAFDGDPDDLLPQQKQWMGERAYFDRPWWHRPDASMMDIMAGPEADIDDKPDIIVDWLELMGQETRAEDGGSAEIIRPSFRPRLVTDD